MNRSCIRFFGYICAGITSLMGRINNATAGQIGNTYYETIVNQVRAYGSRCRSIIQELCPGAYCNNFSVDGYECYGDGSGIICNSRWVFAYRNADYTDDASIYNSDPNSDGCHYMECGTIFRIMNLIRVYSVHILQRHLSRQEFIIFPRWNNIAPRVRALIIVMVNLLHMTPVAR